MRRNIVVLAVIASFGVGAFAMNATAGVQRGGATLAQRVSDLEDRADKQARAIAALREDISQQKGTIQRLLDFRTRVTRWQNQVEHRISKLNPRGVYTGPVDNSQVQVGGDPQGCGGRVAEWNATAKSLGCAIP